MHRLLQAHRVLQSICRLTVLTVFIVLITAVLIQVTGRISGNSPVWTEELTRFALIYLTAAGAGLGLMSGDLVNVDIVCDSLPSPWPKWLRIFASLATAGLSIAMIPGAIKYMQIGTMQKSAALTLQMNFVHFSVLLLFSSLLAFALIRAILDFKSINYSEHQVG